MTHELKILPQYFQAVWDEKKRFKVRKNDRDFQVGDTLILREWDNKTKRYSGSALLVKVVYMLTDSIDGIEYGYCVLGIERFGR